MARIGKAEHGRILHLVDVERRKVAEIAAEYGCTPANIYALLSKLRRASGDAPEAAVPALAAVPEEGRPVEATNATDLFAAAAVEISEPASPGVKPPRKRRAKTEAGLEPSLAEAPVQAVLAESQPDQPAPARPAPVVHALLSLPRREPGKSGGLGASLAKPGFGLAMRTSEGDENLTPFRSLDDLLSAVKPILRSAARSPDAVWFSIQPIDLATLDSDAA